MHDLIIPYVNAHMALIADHISGLLVRIADCSAAACQRTGLPGRGDTEMCMHQIDKSGTVRSIGQAVSPQYIRASHKLKSIGSYCTAASATTGRTTTRRTTI